MTKEQAIQLIDSALSQLRITRQEHAALMQALEVLKKDSP